MVLVQGGWGHADGSIPSSGSVDVTDGWQTAPDGLLCRFHHSLQAPLSERIRILSAFCSAPLWPFHVKKMLVGSAPFKGKSGVPMDGSQSGVF